MERCRFVLLAGFLALGGCDPETGVSVGDATSKRPASKVELKITIRQDEIELARDILGLDSDDAEQRDVTFYDTPDLSLYEEGVLLRSRDVVGGESDTTVKVRPLEAKNVDTSWFSEDGFKCEIDRTSTKSVSSCSLTSPESGKEIREVGAGTREVKKIFSDEQEDFVDLEGTDVPWDEVVPLGPIAAEVWEIELDGVDEAVDVELWTLPDGREILEVSTKVKSKDADKTLAALSDALDELGLDASTTQETKTKAALDYFAEQGY